MRKIAEHTVPTGSMADIAFLLLIFFFAISEIFDEQGISMTLPPFEARGAAVTENVFHVPVNRNDEILAGDAVTDIREVEEKVRTVISSRIESPDKLVISLHCDSQTSYAAYFAVHHAIRQAYRAIWDSLSLSVRGSVFGDIAKDEQERIRSMAPLIVSEAD